MENDELYNIKPFLLSLKINNMDSMDVPRVIKEGIYKKLKVLFCLFNCVVLKFCNRHCVNIGCQKVGPNIYFSRRELG